MNCELPKSGKSLSFDIHLQLENGQWMLGLLSSEVSKSIFKITNEKIKFEKTKTIEKEEKRYSLEDLRNADEKSRPKDLTDDFLGTVVSVQLNEFELLDINTIKKSRLT